MIKALKRAMALLLCLTLCLGLFPSAFAEELEAYDEEETIREIAESDNAADVIETAEGDGEIDEPEAEPRPQPEEEAAEDTAGEDAENEEPEVLPNPVRVLFLAGEDTPLDCLSVTDADGQVLDPVSDPDSGELQYGCYLLTPGDYVCRFHDETGRYADLEEPFHVEECEQQFISIDPELTVEEYTFSQTYIDPLYADVITEEDIPSSPYTHEEMLAELRELADAMDGAKRRSTEKFMLSSGIVHETVESAAAELKEQIMAHEEVATIRLAWSTKPDNDTWNRLCEQIMLTALAHTGVPTEGDYLRYEHGGYSTDGAVVLKGGRYVCRFDYSLLHFTTLEQENELTPIVDSILESLSLDGKNDYQKVFAIYQYLCDNVKYGGNGNLKYTAYSALKNKLALCQGYSAAFYRLCLAAGVDNRFIKSTEMGHAWNIVRMGGLYFELDSTWDAGEKPEDYRFFLKGSTYWLANHINSGISVLGDQFENSDFAAQYTLPTYDYNITRQPGNVSVLKDSKASFSVEAAGSDLTYCWQTLAADGSEWQTVPEAADRTLTVKAALADDGRCYRCVVSNSAGPVLSEAAILTVLDASCTFSLNLADSFGINFFVSGGDVLNDLTISWTKKDGTQVAMPVTDGKLQSAGKYYFALEKLAAKEMILPIPVKIMTADGTVVKETSCSVRSYCESVQKMQDPRYDILKPLCRAALEYGAYAQTFFNYRTDDLAAQDLHPETLPTVPDDFKVTQLATCTGIEYAQMTLTLVDRTQIKVYFFPVSDAYTADQYEATVTNAAGEVTKPTISTASNGALCVSIPGIPAAGLGDAYTVTLAHKDKSHTTVTASALSYPWLVQGGEEKQANVCKALYNYYLNAKAYFDATQGRSA